MSREAAPVAGVRPTPAFGDGPAAIDARCGALLVSTADEYLPAFEELYARTAPGLFGICLDICGERSGAQAVMVDVYAAIWTQAAEWERSETRATAWLAGIAGLRAIGWKRDHPAPAPGGAPIIGHPPRSSTRSAPRAGG